MNIEIVQAEDVLFNIPITQWVLGTVEKVVGTNCDDPQTWNRCWYEQYEALGGSSKNSGNKSCPRAAARGLWFLGYLNSSDRPLLQWTVNEVLNKLSKNAAYAAITVDLLATGSPQSASELWPLVQMEFNRFTDRTPANSDQGVIRLVMALFRNQKLRFPYYANLNILEK